MAVITLRISDEEHKIIKEYAKLKNESVSEIIRESTLSKIEYELDLRLFNEAYDEYIKNPKTC